ncbi:MAG TPA: hypothetical protein VMR86_05475 [Myxococcota bacterium]|nr:hypothetical protein [Myxococcota bacterium]
MKRLVGLLVAVVCLASASPSQAGLTGFLSVKVSGTIQQQVDLPVGSKVGSAKLSNQTIFDDFGVSPDQYELVMSFAGPVVIELLPKSLLAKMPVIPVFTLENGVFLLDSKQNQERFSGGLTSPASAGLFQDLTGGASGILKFGSTGFPKAVSLTGEGSSFPSQSLFKLKVSSHGIFVQTTP